MRGLLYLGVRGEYGEGVDGRSEEAGERRR
jgi:hypothetical protein